MPPNPMETGGPATRIVQLTEAVTMEELANDEEYQDLVDDMRGECGKVCTADPSTFLGDMRCLQSLICHLRDTGIADTDDCP